MNDFLGSDLKNFEIDFKDVLTINNHNETKTELISDGLIMSLSNLGKVDIPYIAELTDHSKVEVINELRGSIFQNPAKSNGDPFKGWETKDEYLSGNIREKLMIAQASNALYHGKFQENVNVLKKMLDSLKGVNSSEIFVTLGSPWVPNDVVSEFVRYLLVLAHAIVTHDLFTGTWEVDAYQYGVLSRQTYGTDRINAVKIIEHTLNQTNIVIYDSKYNYKTSKYEKVRNEKETILALQKQRIILDRFRDWIFSSPDRKERLTNIYNSLYCTNFVRLFDGSFLKMPGLNPNINLFDYQKNAIARVILSPNTLLAHDVGSGKTYEMIAAAHELKRMGLSKKNLIVVPNNIVDQWEKMYKEMYENANILVIRPKDFVPVKREETLNKVKNNDYDSIIIPYSCFDLIHISPNYRKQVLEEKIENNRKAFSDYKSRTSIVTRDFRKYRKGDYTLKLEEKIGVRDPNVIYFEDLEIDRLFLDECHNYKNVPIDTNINVLGINTHGSLKCEEMMHKVHYVQKTHNGGGVCFASGTPITNSITDVYIIQRYLQEGELSLLKIKDFNSWITNYAEKTERFEIDVDTSKCRMVSRYVNFQNLPELTSLLSNIADFHHIEKEKDLPEFKGYTDVQVPPRSEFLLFLKAISKRADKVRAHNPIVLKPASDGNEEVKDNMLAITTDGRKAALDIRLIDEEIPFDESSKVEYCARNVKDIYDKSNDFKGTQLIFCDTSTPKQSFNIYSELKRVLINKGIPEEEIAFIHDAESSAKRKALFSNVNKGNVRVLIGSTFKLATGVNVQERLIAIHHIDVPWRPSDMVQREGRILRQGNKNKEIYIFRYVCESSFDAYSWQLLESKQLLISRLLNNNMDIRDSRDLDDSVLSYAEIKALAVGDPLIEERVNIQNQLSRLIILNNTELAKREKLKATLRNIEDNKEKWEEEIENCKKDIEFAKKFDNFDTNLSEDDKKNYRENLFKSILRKTNTGEEEYIAEHRGFKIYNPSRQPLDEEPFIYLVNNNKYYVKIGVSNVGYLIRINNFIDNLDKHLARLIKQYENNMNYYTQGQEELTRSISYQKDIETLKSKLISIDEKMAKEKKLV